MVEVIRKEWKHFGPWHFMFASMPATLLTLSLHLSTAFRQRKTWDLKYGYYVKLIMDITDKLYVSELAMTFGNRASLITINSGCI